MWPFRARKKPQVMPVAPSHHSIVVWEPGHVRAAVVRMTQGTAELLGVGASPVHGISRTAHPDVDRWSAGCDAALTEAEDMTVATVGHKVVPDYVTMSVPSEITQTFSVEATVTRRDDSRSVAFAELTELLQRAYRTAQDRLDEQGGADRYDIVSGSLAQLRLDGEPVEDPIGFHGRELYARVSMTLLPVEWIRAMESIAERCQLVLSAIVPSFAAYAAPMTHAASLLVVLDQQHSLVGMVRHGRPEWCSLIDSGEQAMTLAAAEALQLSERQAEALMRVYRQGQLREDVEIVVAQTLWNELRQWMSALGQQATGHTHSEAPPEHTSFLDVTRRMPEARMALETPEWERALECQCCPEIIEMDTCMVTGVLDCTTQASGPHYLLLRSLAQHIARLYAEGDNLDYALANVIQWRRPRR